jgi:hypothetical protein
VDVVFVAYPLQDAPDLAAHGRIVHNDLLSLRFGDLEGPTGLPPR